MQSGVLPGLGQPRPEPTRTQSGGLTQRGNSRMNGRLAFPSHTRCPLRPTPTVHGPGLVVFRELVTVRRPPTPYAMARGAVSE